MATKKKTQFAVLGLLTWNDLSGYDIKKLVDVGLSHFWTENYGQLYPTLEQLVRNGLVRKSKQRKSGQRERFVYTITPAGKKLVGDWIRGPTDPPAVRNELQLKLFLSASSPKQSIRLIRRYQTQQEAQLDEYRRSEHVLRVVAEEGQEVEELDKILAISARTARQKRRQVRAFLITLRHGIKVTEARLAWCEEVIGWLSEQEDA